MIDVCISTHNLRPEALLLTLPSLAQQSVGPEEIRTIKTETREKHC
jgi:hypothetical protein